MCCAALDRVENLYKERGKAEIDYLVCCGLGTGVGRISPGRCATHKRAACQVVKRPLAIPSFHGIGEFHRSLLEK